MIQPTHPPFSCSAAAVPIPMATATASPASSSPLAVDHLITAPLSLLRQNFCDHTVFCYIGPPASTPTASLRLLPSRCTAAYAYHYLTILPLLAAGHPWKPSKRQVCFTRLMRTSCRCRTSSRPAFRNRPRRLLYRRNSQHQCSTTCGVTPAGNSFRASAGKTFSSRLVSRSRRFSAKPSAPATSRNTPSAPAPTWYDCGSHGCHNCTSLYIIYLMNGENILNLLNALSLSPSVSACSTSAATLLNAPALHNFANALAMTLFSSYWPPPYFFLVHCRQSCRRLSGVAIPKRIPRNSVKNYASNTRPCSMSCKYKYFKTYCNFKRFNSVMSTLYIFSKYVPSSLRFCKAVFGTSCPIQIL